VSVAKLCAALGVTHVVNNAYGVQSAAIMKGDNRHGLQLFSALVARLLQWIL
jgi:hypothetical protein